MRLVKPLRERKEPTWADVSDVEAMAAELPASFLMCREMQHQWIPYTARIDRLEGTIERVLECARCGTQRVQEMNRYGHVIRSHYTYAEGYLARKIGRIAGEGRDALRLASVMRQLEGRDEAPAPRRRRRAG